MVSSEIEGCVGVEDSLRRTYRLLCNVERKSEGRYRGRCEGWVSGSG